MFQNMEDEDVARTTEWALLFPLKAGLFAVKSSTMSRAESRKAIHYLSGVCSNKNPKKKSAEAEPDFEGPPTGQRMRMRRGSSMSELDKFQISTTTLPELIRSTTNQSGLSAAQSTTAMKGYGSVPHSPALARNFNNVISTNHGSIGDLMNLKKFGGSSWSVRSETLVAKAVPLSTVTWRNSPNSPLICSPVGSPPPSPLLKSVVATPVKCMKNSAAMTAAQRTQRLSRLLRDTRQPATPPRRKVRCEM